MRVSTQHQSLSGELFLVCISGLVYKSRPFDHGLQLSRENYPAIISNDIGRCVLEGTHLSRRKCCYVTMVGTLCTPVSLIV